MTVRLKITMLITASGFVASLIFSCIILGEMIEQPFHLIDADLKTAAERISEQVVTGDKISFSGQRENKQYWLEIKKLKSGILLYRSPLAKQVEIPWPALNHGATVELGRPDGYNAPKHMDRKEETFRVRTVQLKIDGVEYMVCIGRTIENLKEEIEDTVVGIIGGLSFSVLILAGISYFVAGFILKPVRAINKQAREISEKHLDRRVATSGNNDEFDTLAHTLNKVFDRLQHAFLQQKRLLADASHELKTPLTIMRLALDDSRSGMEETDPAHQAKNQDHITTQVLRMERLVKSLLDLSSLEIEATVTREPVDLVKILSSLIADYRFIGEACRININADLQKEILLEGDCEKLTRAFSNLLDNALKYNVEGGHVTISTKLSSEEITVIVGNSGSGVPETDVPRIFEQFYRVEKSRSLRHGGSGLGLAIVKRIIELHDGTVQFESCPDSWTTVTVFLPYQKGNTAG